MLRGLIIITYLVLNNIWKLTSIFEMLGVFVSHLRLAEELNKVDVIVFFQMSPTRSIPSPAPPLTARHSRTTWTSHIPLAPTSSTNWHNMPLTPKTRRTCARWPPPPLRARSVIEIHQWWCDSAYRYMLCTFVSSLFSTPFASCHCVFVAVPLQALYQSWVLDATRNILAVLEDMPTLKPPIDHLCELLPRLQARYYSIASSSKVIVF